VSLSYIISKYILVLDLVHLIHDYKLEILSHDVSSWLKKNSELDTNGNMFSVTYTNETIILEDCWEDYEMIKCNAQDVWNLLSNGDLDYFNSIPRWGLGKEDCPKLIKHLHTLGNKLKVEVLPRCFL